ncbi:MAG: BON domain-containing protein [Acidobacteria bacterium]|nr:BON domain-containing protein [Acidobacteriota bacterium]
MKNVMYRFSALAGALLLTASFAVAAPEQGVGLAQQRITKSVRKALVTLPFYGVFDNLTYRVDGDTVTLYGHVVRPSTREDAERRVSKLDGVARVVNQIEVLPLSSFDDSIRARAYRTVFGTAGLYRYAMGANPSLHIVVNRGQLTLEGVVGSEADSRFAYIAARQVPGVFSVTNNLRVEGREGRAR